MPSSTHPQAKFDPIPPNLDLDALVESTPNFEWVLRVPAAKIHRLGPQGFEKLVLLHVILGGRPLVIEKWNDRLPRSVFSAQWLEATYDKKEEAVRDIGSQSDMRMTIGHYLRSMKQLTNQWTPSNFRDERRQRLYLKDIDCPPEWRDRLQKILPASVFYMNDNIDQRGRQPDTDSFEDRSIAPSGDLMSSLPEEMRAQNLMCYVGHEGTYTPAHREMCASLGQNIMVEASTNENGEKAGSSVWFMTETKDREVVKEFFSFHAGSRHRDREAFCPDQRMEEGDLPRLCRRTKGWRLHPCPSPRAPSGVEPRHSHDEGCVEPDNCRDARDGSP